MDENLRPTKPLKIGSRILDPNGSIWPKETIYEPDSGHETIVEKYMQASFRMV